MNFPEYSENLDLVDFIPSCISTNICCLYKILIRTSLVPFSSRFFTLIILNLSGFSLPNFSICSYKVNIYSYLELHLHLNISPIVNEMRLGMISELFRESSSSISASLNFSRYSSIFFSWSFLSSGLSSFISFFYSFFSLIKAANFRTADKIPWISLFR